MEMSILDLTHGVVLTCTGWIHLDGVHFELQGDDGLNIHGIFHDVRAILSPTHLQLGSRPAGGPNTPPSPLNVGGRYQFRNRSTWAIEGVGLLVSTDIKVNVQTAVFQWEPGSSTISQYAMLTDISLEPRVLIENSYFGNNRARGTLIKTSDVVVKNNTYNATSMHCILAFPDGTFTRNSTFLSHSHSFCIHLKHRC
jgi:hypothetical protein